ncbi:MAG: hypothetical protein CMI96_00700 [Pelagibacteraceae bacterium]|nr:hypothetical protein [Pelagibacteraceae bacterium]|tara:strand:- start:45480 stop:46265 length:786 start_codon:yes stop_codon:yes gene_type:complete
MKRYYVVGDNTSNSLSPLIFNYWFKKYKINAKYSFVEIKPPNFDKKIKELFQNKQVGGLNITNPYKKKIIKHLDDLDKQATEINAVNCVLFGKIKRGTNTDWLGYQESLSKNNINKKSSIIILGYGGAAQAIYYSFILRGYKNINVFNRTKKLIETKGGQVFTQKYKDCDKYFKNCNLIINTTPLNPLSENQCNMVNKKTIISDIVYRPQNTVFLENFHTNKKVYGISMLINQAIYCFEYWFGFRPKVDTALKKNLLEIIK